MAGALLFVFKVVDLVSNYITKVSVCHLIIGLINGFAKWRNHAKLSVWFHFEIELLSEMPLFFESAV